MTLPAHPVEAGEAVPAFVALHGEGLRDFWQVYDAHHERILRETLELASNHPEFGPLVRAMPPEQQSAQNRQSRERLRRALVDGQWAVYVAELRARGSHYARIGVSFSGWYDVVGSFQRTVVPLLVGALGEDPERLSRAITAMMELIDHGMVTIAEQYLAVKELGIPEDITESRRAAAALRAAKETAEAANRELEAFSYSVAHDLRAPLRAISGFSQALVEDCGDSLGGDAKDHLGRILGASERMGHLIDALLSMSRLARAEIRSQPVSLSDLATSVVEQLRATDGQRSVEFVCAPGLVAHADPVLTRALFENLLGNAWKFTAGRPGARIEFGCSDPGGASSYFVRDNGVGFDMAYAEKLFAPFQRLHSAHEFAGAGIGLATVERVVRRHGGRVWAEGAVDQGATFHFTLSGATRATPREG